MALETTTYQCPACDGKLRFDSGTGKLVCDYCGSSYAVDEIEQLYAAKQEKADEQARQQAATEAAGDASCGSNAATAKMTAAEAAAADAAIFGTAPAAIPVTEQSEGRAVNGTADATGSGATDAAPAPATANGRAKTDDPIQEYLRRSHWDANAEGMREFTCSTCGAALIVDSTTAVSSCPYCGNNAVIPGQLSDTLKPDYVIPFKLGKAAAVQALKDYYKGKIFLPKEFKEKNHMEEIQGVYVPFWLYTGTVDGESVYDGEIRSSWRDSEDEHIDIQHFKVERAGSASFRRVPVDGSSKMPDAHMDSVEPFDYSELQPFKISYLPGYLTDRYDEDAETCRERAQIRMMNSFDDMLNDTAMEYSSLTERDRSRNFTLENVSYVLLPVWMLHTKFEGEDFLFAMNGQTGKLIGDLPVKISLVVAHFFKVFVPLVAVAAALMYIL